MKISETSMLSMIQQAQKTSSSNTSPFNSTNYSTSETNEMSTRFSEEGVRISDLISKINQLDSDKMENLEEMQASIDALELDSYDVSELSDDELLALSTQIYDTMESFKPADAPSMNVDLEELSREELESFVTSFQDDSKNLMENMGALHEMASGRPPMGPPPPIESTDESIINALKSYQSNSETDEDTSFSSLEALLDALENNDFSTLFQNTNSVAETSTT